MDTDQSEKKLSLDPRKMREIVLLLLYSVDANQKEISNELIALVSRECKVASSHVRRAAQKAQEVLHEIKRCNDLLSKVCHEYRIERIGSVERSIARLGIYDLVIEKKIPPKVVFAEAKRLAKKFASEEAATFIHALLGAICSHEGLSFDEEQPVALKEAYERFSLSDDPPDRA